MDDVVFVIALPLLVAAGSAMLSYLLMQSRLEVAVARERESHASTQAKLRSLEQSIPDKIQAVEEGSRRKALEQFLNEFRVEERRYIKENKSSLSARHSIITQERLFFRNIPLSNWVEHEMAFEDGINLAMLNQRSVFNHRALAESVIEPPVNSSATASRQTLVLQ